jgi:glycosyltransferase involved in cell wall biosynthesis
MNIIITTAQVPFVRGGNETLVDGLRVALVERGHRVDVVALPYRWYPHAELVKSMAAWRLLDLSESNGVAVDMVIATKFPSYLASHPHRALWLVHQHRQAYDWYGTPLSDFVNTAEDIRVRKMVQQADRLGIGGIPAARRFAISRNVAGRLARYNGLTAQPLYPPLAHNRWRQGDYGDYLVFINRLDEAKRPALLLDALEQAPAAKAIIAGNGPLLEPLRQRVLGGPLRGRVELPGYVSEERKIELLANARAVYYAPVDEDYGFSTLEGMASARPILTTADAGGVLEFVRDGANGLVSPTDPAALAANIRRLYDEAQLAATLGQQGLADYRAADISWDKVVAALLG